MSQQKAASEAAAPILDWERRPPLGFSPDTGIDNAVLVRTENGNVVLATIGEVGLTAGEPSVEVQYALDGSLFSATWPIRELGEVRVLTIDMRRLAEIKERYEPEAVASPKE